MRGVPGSPHPSSQPDDDPSRSGSHPDGRPSALRLAACLLVLAALLWLPVAGNQYAVTPQLPVLLLLLQLVFGVRVAQGRHKARLTVTVTTVLLVLLLTPYCWAGFQDEDNLYGSEYAVVDMVATALAVAGLAALYQPESGAYVRARAERPSPLSER